MEIELIEFGRKHEADFSADVTVGRMPSESTLCPICPLNHFTLQVRADEGKEILQ